jgi:hypothetical protein
MSSPRLRVALAIIAVVPAVAAVATVVAPSAPSAIAAGQAGPPAAWVAARAQRETDFLGGWNHTDLEHPDPLWPAPVGRPQVVITGSTVVADNPAWPVYPTEHGRGDDHGGVPGVSIARFDFAAYPDAKPETPSPARYECLLVGGEREDGGAVLRAVGRTAEVEPSPGDAWTPCGSGVTYGGLRTIHGVYAFAVRGIAADGTVGRPSKIRWTTD